MSYFADASRSIQFESALKSFDSTLQEAFRRVDLTRAPTLACLLKSKPGSDEAKGEIHGLLLGLGLNEEDPSWLEWIEHSSTPRAGLRRSAEYLGQAQRGHLPAGQR